jgi:hypothetical protein
MHRNPSAMAPCRLALMLSAALAGGSAVANEATLTLTSLSLKVPPATLSTIGGQYGLSFSTADDDTINSELFQGGGSAEYQTYAIVDYPGSEALGALVGVLTLQTPLGGDTNVNGVTDFLEVDRAIASTTTTGVIEIDDGIDFSRGTVTATWQRAANSTTGTVQLKVNLPDFGFQNLAFDHTFEVFQYRGTLTYTRSGTNVTASINLPRVGAPGSFVGNLPVTRVSNVELDRAPVSWTGPGGQTFDVLGTDDLEDVPLPISHVIGRFYAGLVIFADGDPSTPFPDEYDFFDLLIEDLNDSDGNGLPDLTDDLTAAPARPTLAASIAANVVQLQVNGTPGARYIVESSPTLPATTWNSVGEVTLDASGKGSLNAGDANGTARLFRTRTP